MKIFPELTLSDTESDIVIDKLSDPAVKKYLHMLAYNVASSIVLSFPGANRTDEEHLRAVAKAQGQLETLESMLGFTKTDAQSSNVS